MRYALWVRRWLEVSCRGAGGGWGQDRLTEGSAQHASSFSSFLCPLPSPDQRIPPVVWSLSGIRGGPDTLPLLGAICWGHQRPDHWFTIQLEAGGSRRGEGAGQASMRHVMALDGNIDALKEQFTPPLLSVHIHNWTLLIKVIQHPRQHMIRCERTVPYPWNVTLSSIILCMRIYAWSFFFFFLP